MTLNNDKEVAKVNFKSAIIVASIAGIFAIIVAIINKDSTTPSNSSKATPSITQTVIVGNRESDELCEKLKNDADRLSLAFETKKNNVDELDEKRIRYLWFRDKLKSYSNFSCVEIKKNYNEFQKTIVDAQKEINVQ